MADVTYIESLNIQSMIEIIEKQSGPMPSCRTSAAKDGPEPDLGAAQEGLILEKYGREGHRRPGRCH